MLEIAIKLLLALVVGSLIGAEREFREKSAGLRSEIRSSVGQVPGSRAEAHQADCGKASRIDDHYLAGLRKAGEP